MLKALKINQVQKTKVYKDIVEQLKKFILSGRLEEGSRLPTERDLADRFGVSRVSVRQALTVLHEMGLVEGRPGGGTFVSSGIKERMLSPWATTLLGARELLQEPLEVRRIIEPEITRLAALRAGAKNIRDLEKIVRMQESKAQQGLPITEEDTLFHEAIAKATGNNILIKLVQSLHQHLRASRHQSLIAPGGNERSIGDHKTILAAIAGKNPQAAGQAMIDHLKNVERLISQRLKKGNPF